MNTFCNALSNSTSQFIYNQCGEVVLKSKQVKDLGIVGKERIGKKMKKEGNLEL
jgi:hypothetical protein